MEKENFLGIGLGAMIKNSKGEMLFVKRSAKSKNERGKWTFPGGALEFGETLEEGIKREVLEEIGCEVKVLRLLKVVDHILKEEKQHWVNPIFEVAIEKGIPNNLEPEKIEEMKWFSLEQMPDNITVNLKDLFADVKKGKIKL